MNLRHVADLCEQKIDWFAKSPWSSAALWVYAVCWIVAERGLIGWDGWLTIVGIELALAIRRWQGKQ